MTKKAEKVDEVTEEPVEPVVDQEARDLDLGGEMIPLVEKSVRKDGTMLIKIIAPGWGSSGYYPADVLERDGPKVFKANLHTYWNHPSVSQETDRPERDLNDLAGALTKDAYWDPNGQAGPGLYAETRATERYRGAVAELAPHIGMSIRAFGKAREGEVDGRKGNVITELVAARSVDYVTQAGAGGKILELFEAAGRPPTKGVETVTEEEAKVLRESNEELTGQVTTARLLLAEKDALLAQHKEQIAKLREGLLQKRTQEVASTVLTAIEMPAPARQRLLEAQVAKPVLAEDGELNEAAYIEQVQAAATAEMAYVQELSESTGKIKGMGATSPVTGKAALKESYKALFVRQGKSAAEAESLAETAAQGR